jgi:hypothetical protein
MLRSLLNPDKTKIRLLPFHWNALYTTKMVYKFFTVRCCHLQLW